MTEALVTFEQIFSGAKWDKDDCNFFDTMSPLLTEDQKKSLREGPVQRRLQFYYARINNEVVRQFEPAQLNIFDLALTYSVMSLESGRYPYIDGIPTTSNF